jgi:hypothetical protein
MAALRYLLARMRALWRGSDLDRDFGEELESHVDMMTDENIRRGMSRDQARRAALIGRGGAASLQEQHWAAIVGVTPHDPIAVVSIALLLTIVSIVACLIPVRRATRVDPVAALRAE